MPSEAERWGDYIRERSPGIPEEVVRQLVAQRAADEPVLQRITKLGSPPARRQGRTWRVTAGPARSPVELGGGVSCARSPRFRSPTATLSLTPSAGVALPG
jgi:hypothetical protein